MNTTKTLICVEKDLNFKNVVYTFQFHYDLIWKTKLQAMIPVTVGRVKGV